MFISNATAVYLGFQFSKVERLLFQHKKKNYAVHSAKKNFNDKKKTKITLSPTTKFNSHFIQILKKLSTISVQTNNDIKDAGKSTSDCLNTSEQVYLIL